MIWQTKKLDDACEVEYGTRVVNKKHGGSKYPVYGGGGATFFMDRSNRENRMVVARFAMSEQCTRFVTGEFFLNDSGLTLSPKDTQEISQDFLNWQTLSLNDQIYSLAKGSAQKNLDVPAFRRMEIVYPESLTEQKRIVKKLDEVFEKVTVAKENAEKNLQNSKELFEAYLQSVFENPGKDWAEKRFDEVCVLQRGFDLPARLRKGGDHPLVSSNGITDSISLWKIKAPGVVTGRSGTIGNVHFIEEDFWPLNTALYIKNFHGNDERFIFYFLKQFNLLKHSSGAGVPTLNRNNVHIVKVFVPKSLAEQKAIVKRLDTLSAETKKLEKIYEQKLASLEELKKSVLQQAFTGKL